MLTKPLSCLLSEIYSPSNLNLFAEPALRKFSIALLVNTTILVILNQLGSISNILHFPMTVQLPAWHGVPLHGTLVCETVSLAGPRRSGKTIFIWSPITFVFWYCHGFKFHVLPHIYCHWTESACPRIGNAYTTIRFVCLKPLLTHRDTSAPVIRRTIGSMWDKRQVRASSAKQSNRHFPRKLF